VCTGQRFRLAAHPAPTFPELDGRHPCFSSGPAKQGRLHLPVSPACNIACAFCRRDFNPVEQRPGVARGLLKPDQALALVGRALDLCPEITVVGIAGPGDTLATDHALETFERVNTVYPNLINCLSTNGLRLEELAERAVAAGVRTITVTVNAVDPEILSQLCHWIVWQRQRLTGRAAAERLITNQLAGIRRAVALGAVVKINAVLVPTINDHHIGEIARTVKEAGASIINVIPLIPQHDLAHLPAPTPEQVAAARAAATQHLSVFSHCQRCRADACGIPGQSDHAAALHQGGLSAHPTFSHG